MQSSPTSTDEPSLASTVGSMAAAIAGWLSPGDVADLRRLAPDDVSCAAFWRMLALHSHLVPEGGPIRDEVERRWMCILQAMAVMAGLHNPTVPLGRALAEADVAEQRLLRLLRASGPTLVDAVRVTAQHLAQKAVDSNHVDIARLVLSDGGPNEESVRRAIARSYYAHTAKEA
ncbi:MAG: type I-E CRISPR-associated protein Cse2/CasB [Candidatus Binatia bacterium]